MSLQNKHILITAGPTWVPIDNVRVISNIATGKTGFLLAKELIGYGAKVTLLLGPVDRGLEIKGLRIIRFNFFDELKNIITKELKSGEYDIFIHSAAVSDYKPKIIYNKKIKSGIKDLKLILEPAEKIIEVIKKLSGRIFLVGFKFESGLPKPKLLSQAQKLIESARADLVVANTVDKNRYRAYIVSKSGIKGPFLKKELLAKNLTKILCQSCGPKNYL